MPRGPSRLREVYNLDMDPTVEDATVAARASQSIVVGDSVTYAIGAEVGAFADAFDSGRSGEIFGESGLLASYYSIGQDVLSTLQETGDDSPETIHHWELECRTWDLVQRLYLERTKEFEAPALAHENKSNHALEQSLYETDQTAAEIKIVLDWLRDGARAIDSFENRGNRWFYTKESIKSRERKGRTTDEQGIVTELDPDAPIRQNKRLEEQDTTFERVLMKAMYLRIRAGDYGEAADIARQSGNHWRAASLQGCVEDRSSVLDGTGDTDEREGNTNKALWRRMCFALSRQSGIDTFERAMYGALCGDVSSVLPVCPLWEDRLWANFNAMNQSKVEAFLKGLNRIPISNEFPIEESEHIDPGAALDSLLHSENEDVKREAKSPMRIIQAHIITGRIDALLLDMQQQLLSIQAGGPPNVGSSPRIVTFVAHLVLALRQMDIAVSEDAANSILQAYVELLISAGQGDAVALYASYLPENIAIESLARHLARVDDEEQRKAQLRLAVNHGIEIGLTVLSTVELVFEDVLSNLIPAEGLVPIKEELAYEEERCIRAFEWTKHDETLQLQAVVLGNNLFRKLLLAGRVNSARVMATRMPDTALVSPELISEERSTEEEDEESVMRNAIEYVGYCTLVRALTRYEDWKDLSRQRPEEINGRRDPVGLRQWKADLARLKFECTAILKEIVEGNWCDPADLGISSQDRKNAIDQLWLTLICQHFTKS